MAIHERHTPRSHRRQCGGAIAEAGKWWTANRPNAPDAFVVDLERALQLIASQPAIRARTRNAKLEDVRRVHLARVRYYLYYRLTSEPAIEVLALWHTSRGAHPQV